MSRFVGDERPKSPRPQATIFFLRDGQGDAQRREVEAQLETKRRLEGAQGERTKRFFVLVAPFEEGGKTKARDLGMSQNQLVIDESDQRTPCRTSGLEADGRIEKLKYGVTGAVLRVGGSEAPFTAFLVSKSGFDVAVQVHEEPKKDSARTS